MIDSRPATSDRLSVENSDSRALNVITGGI
jgi:hypothetical protein